jgi:aminodeoxyfutalosine synthase
MAMDRMREIERKIETGTRLDEADALFLFESPDLMRIGSLADQVNRKKSQDRIFYNINRHINPTNICALSCKFCAFSRKPGEEGAYAYEIEEMVEKARAAVAQGATELHMVGGLHPRWPFKRYLDMIATLHREFPGTHLKAFTAVELDWMARKERRSLGEILKDLKDAGLGSLPGGGAEIFHPEIRDQICDTKVSAEQWIDTHRMAHKMGLRSNCTMLYGHIERHEHRVDHMRRLRELQDETGGFNVFIPLAFQPYQNDMGIGRYTFGYDDLKTIAVARLYLDNFANIKAYWVMMGQDMAQLGLQFGANDFDGTVTEEKISRMAGGRAGMVMSRSDLEHLILRTGRTPVERDTLYRPIDLVKSIARAAALRDSAGDANSQALPVSRSKKLAFAIGSRVTLAGRPALTHLKQIISQLVSGATVEIEISDNGTLEWKDLIEACGEVRAAGAGIVLSGLATATQMMANASIPLSAGFEALASAGVRRVVQSAEDQTLARPEELLAMHKAAHAADIPTAGRVTLRARTSSAHPGEAAASRVDWADFQMQLHGVSEGLRPLGVTSIILGTGREAVITASEYLHAVNRLKSAAGQMAWISAPLLSEVPTLAPVMGLGSDGSQHPAQKLVPLLADFGADDLGVIDASMIKVTRLMEDIRSAGLSVEVQSGGLLLKDDAAHATWDKCDDSGLDLRHKPTDRI